MHSSVRRINIDIGDGYVSLPNTSLKMMLHETIRSDDFSVVQHGYANNFLAIFALQVFESASKTCNAKTVNFVQVVSCNIPVVKFLP